jgi:hypothetical protein
MSEWLYDGPPATPLGEDEDGFHARRPARRAA